MDNKEQTPQFTDVNELGEFGLIDKVTSDFRKYHNSTLLGIGDDAAVIDIGNGYQGITTDMLMEGIHFDVIYSPMRHLGYKSVVVNLSDIYAMNMTPQAITVSIAISNRYSVEAVTELYNGIRTACDMYKVDLIGGDTTSNLKGLAISVTAVGYGNNREEICFRSGAQKGDILCVTGDLGAAYLGLQLLEREKQLFLEDNTIKPDFQNQYYLIERQLKPEARKDAIEYFNKVKLIPTSMIDISDGLSSDLFHLCNASGLGAFIEESKVPIHPQAKELALEFNMDPISCALSGGEDYELLFTVSPEDLEKIKYMPGAYIIGEMVAKEDGVTLHTTGGNIHQVTSQGWNHFNSKS